MFSLISALCHLLLVAQLHLSLIWMLWQDMAGAVGCNSYLLLWEPLRATFLRSSFLFPFLSSAPLPLCGLNQAMLHLLSGEKLTLGIQVGIHPNALTPLAVGEMKWHNLGGA
jgi:hypothetical protein